MCVNVQNKSVSEIRKKKTHFSQTCLIMFSTQKQGHKQYFQETTENHCFSKTSQQVRARIIIFSISKTLQNCKNPGQYERETELIYEKKVLSLVIQ